MSKKEFIKECIYTFVVYAIFGFIAVTFVYGDESPPQMPTYCYEHGHVYKHAYYHLLNSVITNHQITNAKGDILEYHTHCHHEIEKSIRFEPSVQSLWYDISRFITNNFNIGVKINEYRIK